MGEIIKDASLCGLGQTAPNPVLTTLNQFLNEYEEHIQNQRCPAGVCRELITFHIDPDSCTGCGLCRRSCPQKAITGEKKEVHILDQSLCVQCGMCKEVCNFDAVVVY